MAVLLAGAGAAGLAQSAENESTGSLSGKLTDLHSKPLDGVTVVARNQATGTEARTITTKNGTYRFIGLEPGAYALEAESSQLGRGQVEDIEVDAGYEARVQTAMEFEPLAPSPVLAAHGEEQPELNPPDLKPAAPAVIAALPAAKPLPAQQANKRMASEDGGVPAATAPKAKATLAVAQGERNQQLPAPTKPANPAPAAVASAPSHTGTNVSQLTKSGSSALVVTETVQTPPHPAGLAAAAPVQAEMKKTQAPRRPAPAASQMSRPAEAAATSTISAAELQALPVSGRHWQDFVLDNTPTSVTPAGGQGQISLRGAGQQPAGIAVDGANRGLAFGPMGGQGQGSQGAGPLGQGGDEPAGMAQAGVGGHGLGVSEAAIRAVQTAAGNVEAEAARAAGGHLNAETERGANELHGQGFLFDRQNTWGARNPFTQWVRNTGTIAVPVFTPEPYTPPDRETTWGIGLGSRIRRDKLFWFAALDGYERNNSGLATVKHPDEFFAQPANDQMQVLSARLGLSSANPVAEGLTAYSGLLESLDGLLGPSHRKAKQWTGFGRIDWEAAERHRFTLEAIGAHWNAPGGGLTRVSETYGSHSFGSTEASEELLLGRWEAFLTPNLLAVTQASAGHALEEARPDAPSAFEQSFLSGNAWGQLPQVVVDSRYGFTIGNPSRFGTGSYPDERLYTGQESVDWIRGNLLVKAGFDVSHNFDATSLLRNRTGTYHYANVENFASDALVFGAFGLTDALDPDNQHNCDETGKVWRDSGGTLRGLGNLPCYSYYSQTMGPTDWHLSTNDWAGFATAQWQAGKLLVVSAGLRWEREQLPPPIAALSNPGPLLSQKLPNLGNNWGPRVSVAVGSGERHWPVLRLGYGMYFGRTENATLETALTQTGSPKGDLSFFMRPTDDLPNSGGGAPPFPYVLAGEPASAVKPGAVEFAASFHNSEVHQAVAAMEETLPGHVEVTASAMVSLGRRLPVSIDTNFDPAVNPGSITYAVVDGTGNGPIKATQITVPLYASWPSATSATGFAGRLNPDYQQITQIMSRANSTYEAGMVKVARYGRRGLSLHAHYTYAHAMDWNPNESAQAAGNDVLDPADFKLEYGTSSLDIRHSAAAMAIYEAPWKLHGAAGRFGNGWMLSGILEARGGLPFTMRTSGSLPQEVEVPSGALIVGLGPGMNGSGGDSRVYGVGNDNRIYNIGRNSYRYPATWKADLRLGKRFDLGAMRQLELLAESFNLFNHENVTELETTGYTLEPGSMSGSLPTLNFLTGLEANTTPFGHPLNIDATNFYRERQFQFGLRIRF
jgi:hypothetical protein